MEFHHLYFLLETVDFHCYVSLPEGIQLFFMSLNLSLMALEQTHISGVKNTWVWIGVYSPYHPGVAFIFTYMYHKNYLH